MSCAVHERVTLSGLARLAETLANALRAGDVVALVGDLGAGKTAFVRALFAALGGDAAEVTSPTFSLIDVHELADTLFVHADLYRLQDNADIAATGLLEYAGAPDTILAVEWPELAWSQLAPTWRVTLVIDPAQGDGAVAARTVHVDHIGRQP